MRALLITLISLVLCHQPVMADAPIGDFYDMHKYAKEIDFALDYTSITIQKGHILNRKIGNRNLDEIDEVEMEKHLREVFESYIEMYEKRIEMEPSKLRFFKDAYQAVHYKTIWADFKHVFKNMKLSLKKRGAGFWLALMCGVVNEIIFDLTAWAISPWLLSITLSIPYNIIWISGWNVFARLNMKKRLIKVLGSKQKYEEYMQFKKSLASTFQKKSFDRYIVPLKTSDGEISTVVINKRTLWEKLLWKMDSETKIGWKSFIRKMGLKDGAVNYFNVLTFLETNGIENEYLKSVRKSPLNQKAKVALILNHIFMVMDEDTQIAFKEKFSSSFITLNQSTSWKHMRSWTKRMLKLKTWDDVREGFKQLPDWVDAREIEGIWKNILLPHYSETFDIGYFKYRKILTDLELMRAQNFLYDDQTWDLHVASKFLSHVESALKLKNAPVCYNDHSKVLRFLIRQLTP